MFHTRCPRFRPMWQFLQIVPPIMFLPNGSKNGYSGNAWKFLFTLRIPLSFPPLFHPFPLIFPPCYDWTVPVLARIEVFDAVLVRVLLVLLRGVAVVAIDIEVPCFSSSGLNGLESLWVEEEQPMALPVFSHNVLQRLRGRGAVFWLCEKTATAKKVGFRLWNSWTFEIWFCGL